MAFEPARRLPVVKTDLTRRLDSDTEGAYYLGVHLAIKAERKLKCTAYCVFALLAGAVLTGRAQLKTPADFLRTLPSIPQTSAEAVQRCPHDRDEAVLNILAAVHSHAEIERDVLRRDSLRLSADKKGNTAPPDDAQRFDSLEIALVSAASKLHDGLSHATAKPSEDFLEGMREIGERLDATIKQCPKVAGPQRANMPPRPPTFTYDSSCVAAAEMQAAFDRQHEAFRYLSTVNANWKRDVVPLLQSLEALDRHVTRLEAGVNRSPKILQLRNWRCTLWSLVEETLKRIGSVSELAAQFSK